MAFDALADAVRGARFRADLTVREIPAPGGLAPEAVALAANVRDESLHDDSPYGAGRFILLHDPSEPAGWDGPLRIVTFAGAPLETEIGADPLLTDVAWAWLIDALASRGAAFHASAGTATKTVSKGFGSLASQGEGAQIELRASWSPSAAEHIVDHVEAWAELVCMLAGLPPGSEDAPMIAAQRWSRD